MEVLRWTGQPRMALVNLIGEGRYVDEWRRALDQFFSLVRVFDAVRADFGKRIDLLRAFGELREDWAPRLARAADALAADRARRRHRAATEIADALIDVLSARESAPIADDAPDPEVTARLTAKLKAHVRARERTSRRVVQEIYHHERLEAQEDEPTLLADDLFSERTFNVFGLSTQQLAITGAASGAVAGGGIDLLLGGASLLLGAGIGALLGGAGAVFGAHQLARTEVLGQPLGGYRLNLGPITDANLPWVLLGRALLHWRLVSERNHARREALLLAAVDSAHRADAIDAERRRRMEPAFRTLRKGGDLDAEARRGFVAQIEALLGDSLLISAKST